MEQNALTVVVPIKEGQSASLKVFLGAIGKNIKDNPYVHFTALTSTHFARWVVIDGDARYAPCLAFESNYDGPLDQHLDDLVDHGAAGLDGIYNHCKDYPTSGTKDPAAFKQFMRDHAVDYAAFYIAYRGQTVQNIRNNTAVRDAIEQYLDAQQASGPIKRSSFEVYSSIRDFLRKQQSPTLSLEPIENGQTARWCHLAALYAALGLTALILLPLLILWLIALRIHELRDAQAAPLSQRLIKPISAAQGVREDEQTQNQLTHIVDIKPGLLRLLTLRAVLWAINLLAKYQFNQGSLGGIPTIHFARWVILDNRRLLFFSNYDGSWENYLGDFIDRAHVGLTGVWSNTVGFPKTLFLLWKGATDEQNFKQWTREHQIPTQVWYSAHPDETVRNILNNIQIRGNVERSLTPEETDRWLTRL